MILEQRRGRASHRSELPWVASLVSVLAACSTRSADTQAEPPQEGQTSRLQLTVRAQTDRLLETSEFLGGAAGTTALEAEARELALRREVAMTALMEAAPQVAIGLALSEADRARLPEDIRIHVEARSSESGVLEVLGVLRDDGGRAIERYLVNGNRRLRLSIAQMPEEYLSGTVLTVNGLLLGDLLAGTNGDVTIHQAVTGAEPNNIGTRYALVININFSDQPAQPWTVEFADNVFNNMVRSWFEEGSYGQTSLVADVIGWFTIDAPSTSCASGTFRTLGEAAARAAGYEPNDYNHVVLAFPRPNACSWAGLGQVPGRITWINATVIGMNVPVHELGHNLGLAHSHSRRCSEGPLSGSCTVTEYGDRFDTMGSGGRAHYHASYRQYVGWIPSSDVFNLTPDDRDAVVALNSAETSFGTRVLRVQRTGMNQYLFVEAREAVGFDSVLSMYPALLNGVAIYLGTTMRDQSIVDIGYTTTTVADAPLQFGETVYDFEGDVSITPLYNADGLTYVQVHYGLAL